MDTFKDIFFNPKSYNLIPFNNVFDDNKNIGFFKPHYNNIMSDNKPVASKEEIDKVDAMNTVKNTLYAMMQDVKCLPGSREKALVITKIQEAIFWAEEDIQLHHKF